jgi:hypothetical protein
MLQASPETTSSNGLDQPRRQSEIGRLLESIEEACEICVMIDDKKVEDSAKNRALHEVAQIRIGRLEDAIAELEPETIEDAMALVVVAYHRIGHLTSGSDAATKVEHILHSGINCLRAHGITTTPRFSERYIGCVDRSWHDEVIIWRAKAAELRAQADAQADEEM